jgi:hypothetical protein
MHKFKVLLMTILFVLLTVASTAYAQDNTAPHDCDECICCDIILWDVVGATDESRDGGDDDGVDIILWDVVGATDESRDGGDDDGVDIILWDIVDGVTEAE